jgi:hypothetical protein
LFYPELPHRRSVIFKICRRLGVRISTIATPHTDLAVHWRDSTFSTFGLRLSNRVNILNLDCDDISKEKVSRVFAEVFGYSASVDPTAFRGRCVEKSNVNALHDGRIIDCPIATASPGSVYQILIANEADEKYVRDLRAPVLKNEIPFVYFKYKLLRERFTNAVARVEIEDTAKVFSAAEIENILAFCRKMGLDYGELDVLRDRHNGRIYIIDMNKTPWGPPQGISEAGKKFALRRLAETFERIFLSM